MAKLPSLMEPNILKAGITKGKCQSSLSSWWKFKMIDKPLFNLFFMGFSEKSAISTFSVIYPSKLNLNWMLI